MPYRSTRPISPPPPRSNNYRAIPTDEVYVRFRLLTAVPLSVRFPSITYGIMWSVERLTHRLQLIREDGRAACTIYSWTDQSPVEARQIAWTMGVILKHPGMLDTVFSRLVREGRAEIVQGPHSPVVLLKPGGGQIYYPET